MMMTDDGTAAKDYPRLTILDERIKRVLLECPKHNAARYDLETATNKRLTLSILCEMLAG